MSLIFIMNFELISNSSYFKDKNDLRVQYEDIQNNPVLSTQDIIVGFSRNQELQISQVTWTG